MPAPANLFLIVFFNDLQDEKRLTKYHNGFQIIGGGETLAPPVNEMPPWGPLAEW
jgi:hypothetical protein